MTLAKHVIFDLDGTLVDSAPLIASLVNELLDVRGVSRRVSAEHARPFLTQGGERLVANLLGEDARDRKADVEEFRALYRSCPTPEDCLFDGVREGLEALAADGVRMAICSNKPQALCEKTVADLGIAQYFTSIAGSRDELPLKPSPELARLALDGLGIAGQACPYVGDSEVDRQTAANAGLEFLHVTYGYAEDDMVAGGYRDFASFGDVVAHLRESTDAAKVA